MSKKNMTFKNWVCVFCGILLILCGYVVAYGVRTDFYSFRAFFAVLLMNLGLFSMIFGLAFSFDINK